ncbi:MAG: tyrosine-type recombinase/integrase [Chitinophagaceae bacterium]|nr:tyrosine-type recombinase/integrase [Chitinophagaceae bacterium]
MLQQLIRRTYYLNKHLEAPLLKEREEHLQYLADKGCSHGTLKTAAEYLLRIVQFLRLEKDEIVTIDDIEHAATAWSKSPHHHQQKKRVSPSGRKKFTSIAINWLKRINHLACPSEGQISLFNHLFERRHALKRHTSAPLLNERLQYLQHRADLKAKDGSLRIIATYLLIIMDFLKFYSIRLMSIQEINDAAQKWATNKMVVRRNNNYSKFSQRRFIYYAVNWFKMLGCLMEDPKPATPFQEYLDKYLEYMLQEQGLAEETIYIRTSLLKNFLILISTRVQTFAAILPGTVDEVLTMKYDVDRYSRRSVQSYASVIRSFLRYAENQKWCQRGIATSIKSPRVYRYETLPSAPHWEDVKKLVANSQTDYSTDIRDYPILLLLTVYGMRRSEVAGLKLQDIDWKNEQIYLRRAKRSKPQIFPLSKTVGEAILRYLKEVRPSHCRSKELFIARRSPYHPLTAQAIYAIVNRRLKPLSLPIKHLGPHALRHACATHLINEGFCLKEISDHLGHQELETTRIYTKVDLVNLRKVAEQNWEGLL